MKSGIHIGNEVDFSKIAENLEDLTTSIVRILDSPAGDDVKIEALKVIKGIAQSDITHNNFSNISISGGSSESTTQATKDDSY
jgi:hypothetical protein